MVLMKKETCRLLENYMLSCMDVNDSVHGSDHIYRVLYTALDIAEYEESVDYDVLIAACLLHDIGRAEEFADPAVCHAQVGAKKAYQFLMEHGFAETFSSHVRDCIYTHRFRSENPPISIEAKILFDADKIDATGAIGIARTLMYKAMVSEPLYLLTEDGQVSDGITDEEPSFFQEYHHKLAGLYSQFFTKRATELAAQRRDTATVFSKRLLEEIQGVYSNRKKYFFE